MSLSGATPEGWAIHNPPAKIAKKVDESKDHYEMFQSRYPQQGFESFCTQGTQCHTACPDTSNEWVTVCNWDQTQERFLKARAVDGMSAQIKFLHAMFRKQGSFDERATVW